MQQSESFNSTTWIYVLGALVVVSAVAGCAGSSAGSTAPTQVSTSPPAIAACDVISGSSNAVLEILNGTACSAAQSSVVLVNLRDKDNQPSASCSGTVIAPRAVLTAAHCLLGDTASVRVWTGAGAEIQASSFQSNPAYHGETSSDPTADVGVVITTTDLNRKAIPLLVSRDARVGETAVIGGWGLDQNGNGTILRAGTTTVSSVSGSVLQIQYSASSSSVCSGDSGGPLLIQESGVWAIAGVTSATTLAGSCVTATNYFAAIRDPNVSSFIFGSVPNAVRR